MLTPRLIKAVNLCKQLEDESELGVDPEVKTIGGWSWEFFEKRPGIDELLIAVEAREKEILAATSQELETIWNELLDSYEKL